MNVHVKATNTRWLALSKGGPFILDERNGSRRKPFSVNEEIERKSVGRERIVSRLLSLDGS